MCEVHNLIRILESAYSTQSLSRPSDERAFKSGEKRRSSFVFVVSLRVFAQLPLNKKRKLEHSSNASNIYMVFPFAIHES